MMTDSNSSGIRQATKTRDKHSADQQNVVIPMSLEEWRTRELSPPDFLMGKWLTTTSRVLIVGATGLGKTNFGLALGLSVAAGNDFLHWKGGRPRRVLYIDGEMPRRLMKERLIDAARRANADTAGFFVISREDLDFPPLNSAEGQKFIIDFVEQYGPFDLILFDNIQALLVGDMTTEDQWAKVLPLVRELSKRSIGQIWFHHTGHDEKKSYGSKAREWQMDTVMMLKRANLGDDLDIAFNIEFTKARERTPETRQDFSMMNVTLVDDRWASSHPEKLPQDAKDALRALNGLLAEGQYGSCGQGQVNKDTWRDRTYEMWHDKKPEARKKAFQRAPEVLMKRRKIAAFGDCVALA